MELSWIGLLIIILGWTIQLRRSYKGDKKIDPRFIIVYAVGVLVLVIDGYLSGLRELALLNMVSLIASVLVLLKIKGKK